MNLVKAKANQPQLTVEQYRRPWRDVRHPPRDDLDERWEG